MLPSNGVLARCHLDQNIANQSAVHFEGNRSPAAQELEKDSYLVQGKSKCFCNGHGGDGGRSAGHLLL